MGLCSWRFKLCKTRGRTVDVRCYRDKCNGVDRVDPSPRDHHRSTCVKGHLSDHVRRLTYQHVDAMGASDLHRTGETKRKTWVMTYDRADTWTPWIKDEIGASWEQRVETSQRSNFNQTGEMQGEGGPASWDCGLSYMCNRGRPTYLHQIERLALFAENFPLKIDVSLFLSQLLIDS